MKRNLLIQFALGLALVLGPSFLTLAQVPAASVIYLKSQSSDAWVVMALAAAGEAPSLEGLKNFSGQSATDYEKQILALTAAGQSPASFDGRDFVKEFLDKFYKHNQIGDVNLLNDEFWGILSLSAAQKIGATDSRIAPALQDAKNLILQNQKSDGGWGFAKNGASDSNDTAVAIMALLEAGVFSQDSSIQKAAIYLQTLQKSDGGMPFSSQFNSDAASDAWVITALNKLGIDPKTWSKSGSNLITHLLTLQNADGSFNWQAGQGANAAITSYAVIALSGKSYPVVSSALKAPIPTPVAVPTPTAVPAPVPTPTPAPAPTPVQVPVPVPVPAPVPLPALVPVPIPVPQPALVPTQLSLSRPLDSDNDMLTDQAEIFYHTDPHNPDTDADGHKDGLEIIHSYDPLNPAPCQKISNPNYPFAYGQNRLKSLKAELCFSRYLAAQIKGISHGKPWPVVLNSFIYGNYSVHDIKRWLKGENTAHVSIIKWDFVN